MKKKYGLIGFPLSHTFSPGYFTNKFEKLHITNAEYKAYPLASIKELPALMASGMTGLNVTIPYKQDVMKYLDEISDEAKAIGAVNTLHLVDNRWIGYNTDCYGFERSLLKSLAGRKVSDALVLGSGGSSLAVRHVLSKLGIHHHTLSRNPSQLTYEKLSQQMIERHPLIINTTPLGMSPNTDTCPDIPYEYLTSDHILFDLIYNPEKTLFLTKGLSKGCTVQNGYDMLLLQADRSWEIWNDI